MTDDDVTNKTDIQLAALEKDKTEFLNFIMAAHEWFVNFCANAPIYFGGEDEMCEGARALLVKHGVKG